MKLVMTLVCAAVAWAQAPADQNVEKVFYFTQTPAQGYRDLITAMRTVADVQSATPDSAAHSLTVRAAADRMPLAEWLFHELDQAAAPVQKTVVHEYPLPVQTPNGPEVAKVFYLAHAENQQFLTDMITGIRTIADVTRLFPYNSLNAVVARSTADRVAAGEWLIDELDQAPGQVTAPAIHAYGVPLAGPGKNDHNNVMKVFFLANAESQQTVTDIVTAIRTVADATRLFPFNSRRALMVSSTPDRVATAEWLAHELDQPASETLATSTYGVQLSLSGRDDDLVVKVFHLSPAVTKQGINELATSIRTTGVTRVFPAQIPRSIALRGSAASLAQAEVLVKQKDQPAAQ